MLQLVVVVEAFWPNAGCTRPVTRATRAVLEPAGAVARANGRASLDFVHGQHGWGAPPQMGGGMGGGGAMERVLTGDWPFTTDKCGQRIAQLVRQGVAVQTASSGPQGLNQSHGHTRARKLF